MLMQAFGVGLGIARPVTFVEPPWAPLVMTGAINGVAVRVGVVVGVLVAVRVGVIVGEDVLVGVAEPLGVLVAVFVAVRVGDVVAVGVIVPVAVGVPVGGIVPVNVAVGVIVGEFVAVPVEDAVAVAVLVLVGVNEGVTVAVGVGVGVDPTTMLPVPGVHGTGVSLAPTIARAHVGTSSGLLPFAWAWKVMLTILMGGVGETGVRQANAQVTLPTGGVGTAILHNCVHVLNGGCTSVLVASTIVESYCTVNSYVFS
jgi:hypothetical protein